MKHEDGTLPSRSRLIMLVLSLPILSAHAADASDSATASAHVTSDCTLTLDNTALDFGSVSATTLKSMEANAIISAVPTQMITTVRTCVGPGNYSTLTFSTTNSVADGNLVPTGDVVRFQITSNSNQTKLAFDDTTKSASHRNWATNLATGHTNKYVITLLAGTNAGSTSAVGTHTSTLDITLSPD